MQEAVKKTSSSTQICHGADQYKRGFDDSHMAVGTLEMQI